MKDELKTVEVSSGSIPLKAVEALNPTTTLETLIPILKENKQENVQRIIDAAPEVVSHNIGNNGKHIGTHSSAVLAKYGNFKDAQDGGMSRTKKHHAGPWRKQRRCSSNLDLATWGRCVTDCAASKKHLAVATLLCIG
jgi:hypothetical protein